MRLPDTLASLPSTVRLCSCIRAAPQRVPVVQASLWLLDEGPAAAHVACCAAKPATTCVVLAVAGRAIRADMPDSSVCPSDDKLDFLA